MRLPGRLAAAIDVVEAVLAGRQVENAMSEWARGHRFAGSKDRSFIRDVTYDVLRRKQTFARLGGGNSARSLVLGWTIASGDDPSAVFGVDGFGPSELTEAEQKTLADQNSANSEETNMPDWIAEMVRRDWGQQNKAAQIFQHLSARANVHIRVNNFKSSRSTLAERLEKDDISSEHLQIETALQITKNERRLTSHELFEAGHFELQDAHSQAVCERIPVPDRATVLDYCAGGGGKSLAIASRCPTAQISAWDISQKRLSALTPRSDRAGANIRLLKAKPDPKDMLYDVVVLDVPCSGAGSWRRDPQGKWTLTQDRLTELRSQQSGILREGAALTKPGGVLAYITCSLFNEENEDQIKKFLNYSVGWQRSLQKHWLPEVNGDGFFLCIMTTKEAS